MGNNKFLSTFKYKVIYVFRINDENHKGFLKIGDATVHTNKSKDELQTNCEILNGAAQNRINQYTVTAGIAYELLHTELAVTNSGQLFRDHNIHTLLKRSGKDKKCFDTKKKQNEWFEIDLETTIKAIEAVKKGRKSLNNDEISDGKNPIIFRPEQIEAVESTMKQFKKGNRMLWNAKMRFGKTLTALEVSKRLNAKRTIIITHRPVVSKGWFDDFNLIFTKDDACLFGSKLRGESLENLIKGDRKFIYFASLQDLGGSDAVGGKYIKNENIFDIDWDFVVIDEAHEGTKTIHGQNTLEGIIKNKNDYPTKVLELSGTPFNLLADYNENEIYTWDYVMEQEAKEKWYLNNYCDSNPYEELPRLNIFTYNLNKLIGGYEDIADKAFNFREFFRTWTGNIENDGKHIPDNINIGDFVHENDVLSFINLICKEDEFSNYPYSTNEYRNYFRHSLWMLPGVKEAKALSKLLKSHEIFGQFKIVNVAGSGDEEENYNDALKAVQDAIGNNFDENYTITLSCGKLTTGVSVPEWTAVFMLSGTYSTSASNYLQTIFRVQTPAKFNGKIKDECYVFDFAPDRTLKMVAEAGQLSIKAGSTNSKKEMGKFLNYCPVIAISGSSMVPYNVNTMLQQLKKSYANRVVQNGFDDIKIYNDNLLKLDGLELEKFEELQKIVGASKQSKKVNEIDINRQGFTSEEYEVLEKLNKKPKIELSVEDKAKLEDLKKQKDQASTAISILRGISIRIPLLIYGANIDAEEEINCDNFIKIIDDESWNEFMPRGVTKEMFRDFSKYYDQEIFIEAGRQIRNKTLYADSLSPDERVQKISEIFATFRNPDKETVLTPWRTVNMHLGDTIGGYNFFDSDSDGKKYIVTVEEPIFIDNGDITKDILSEDSKILEINSKTGLYPLYVTYSLYKEKTKNYKSDELNRELEKAIWNKTIENNIYVLCKTDMAKSITKRTLLGYNNEKFNIISINNIIEELVNNNEKIINKILSPNTWNKEGEKMKFDAIIGNPPYQLMDDGHGASAKPVYNVFIESAIKMNPNYLTMISPSRWFAGGKGLDSFREKMLKDKKIRILHDYINASECFPGVEIKGGVSYFLRNNNSEGKCNVVTHVDECNTSSMERYLLEDNCDVFIRYNEAITIINKVTTNNFEPFSNFVSSRKPFGLATNFIDFIEKSKDEKNIKIYANQRTGYISRNQILKNKEWVDKWKVYVPEAIGSGDSSTDWVKPIIGKPNTTCTETYIIYGPFETEIEAYNVAIYTQTRFFHFMLGLKKITQHTTAKVYSFIPMQNFSQNSEINWKKSTAEIDEILFDKYNLTEEEREYIKLLIKSEVTADK
ncbi:MAG: Eco57I restriction-modification methylase domain-containing protein [Bacilli bacterium]